MKILISLVFLALTFHTADLLALTIQAEAEFSTLGQRPLKVKKSFGKLPSSGEYGIFLNITCVGVEGDNDHESLFYRLQSETGREGDLLYTVVDGNRIQLAKKKWYGWKEADGVTIHYSRTPAPDYTFKVWVEVE